MHRYLSGGWNIRGQLILAISPYLLLAGAFVAFLKVRTSGRSGPIPSCPFPFRAVDAATEIRSCCMGFISHELIGLVDIFQLID